MHLKVLHLSSENTWRGGEQQIAYLIGELEKLGVTNFVAVKAGSQFEQYCIEKRIKTFSLPFKNSLDLRTAWKLKVLCRNNKIDIVHMHSSKSHGIGVLSATLSNQTPLVLSRRVDFVPKKNRLTQWKYNHHAIKKILCVSEKINEIMRGYLKSPEKCITVHSGVDPFKFDKIAVTNRLRREFNIHDDAILIGNTSALEAHKDYVTFINTIKILVMKGVPLHAFIIGKGSLESSLKQFTTENGLEKVITFTGFRSDITELLPELNIFLMTSNEEGLGTSVLDAFVAGVPVVATSAGGIPEMVVHEKTGLLSAIGDAPSLAANVEKIIQDDGLKKRLIEAAKEKVKEFTKESTALKTHNIYKAVLFCRD